MKASVSWLSSQGFIGFSCAIALIFVKYFDIQAVTACVVVVAVVGSSRNRKSPEEAPLGDRALVSEK